MKFKRVIILILICTLLTGCWDKVEIERRSFISTIAVDVGESIEDEEELKKFRPNELFPEEDFKKLSVTYGFPNISELKPGEGSSATENSITTEGFSMEDCVTKLASKISRGIYEGHSKLLILSDRIMNHPETVKEIFDYFERNPGINRMMLVVIGKGSVENYVKFQPSMEKNIETYITRLMESGVRNFRFTTVTFNDIMVSLYKDHNAVIPTIEFDKDNNKQINIVGTALINDYKLEGYLTLEEDATLELLKGKVKGGRESIVMEGHPIDFQVTEAKRKIKLYEDQSNKLTFKIDINLEGQLREHYVGKEVFSENELNKIQSDFNDIIERKCEKTARILKEQYTIDAMGLREYVEKFHPKLYKKIKDNWDEVYKNSVIDIVINTNIRRIGITT